MDRGEILWQIAHGETPDNVRNHPKLKGLTIPRTGQPCRRNWAGPGLSPRRWVIGGEWRGHDDSGPGCAGAMLRAYDKASGKEVGAVHMPAQQAGSPMTYMIDGRQYIVLAIGGGNFVGQYVAFRLPS